MFKVRSPYNPLDREAFITFILEYGNPFEETKESGASNFKTRN